jgi:hypothetical protein
MAQITSAQKTSIAIDIRLDCQNVQSKAKKS